MVVGIAVAELLLAWCLGAALCWDFAPSFAAHPRGAFAIFDDGGRFAGELLARPLGSSGLLVGVVLAVHGVAWALLAGALPVLAANPSVRAHRAAAESLRRAPSVLTLAAMHAVLLGVAALAASSVASWASTVATTSPSSPVSTLHHLAGPFLGLGLAVAIGAWHDVSVMHAMARGRSAVSAASSALAQMLVHPLETVGAGLAFRAAGWVMPGVAFVAAGLFERRASAAPLLALAAVQHLAVLGRVHARTKWMLWLAARLPRGIA